MKLLVLVKQVPDTAADRHLNADNGRVDRTSSDPVLDEINEKAVEAALQLREAHPGSSVTVLTMGPERAAEAIRRALAMGADDGIHLVDDRLAGADTAQTSHALAGVLKELPFDLVIAGNESTDGRMGAVPAMIAEILGHPHATFLQHLEVADGILRGQRPCHGGYLEIEAALPAIVSLTEQAADARFPNFRGIMAAKKKPLKTLTLTDAGGPRQADAGDAACRILKVTPRPARTGGEKFTDDGTGAARVASFLTEANLI